MSTKVAALSPFHQTRRRDAVGKPREETGHRIARGRGQELRTEGLPVRSAGEDTVHRRRVRFARRGQPGPERPDGPARRSSPEIPLQAVGPGPGPPRPCFPKENPGSSARFPAVSRKSFWCAGRRRQGGLRPRGTARVGCCRATRRARRPRAEAANRPRKGRSPSAHKPQPHEGVIPALPQPGQPRPRRRIGSFCAGDHRHLKKVGQAGVHVDPVFQRRPLEALRRNSS
jgi:hypothetical protein